MRDVSIIGIGQTPVGEHWDKGIEDLAQVSATQAFEDAGIDSVDMLYIANMFSGQLSRQEHLGSLVSNAIGLKGIEAVRIEAADASGGAALRQGYLAVAGGIVDFVMISGVEKMTDIMGNRRLSTLSSTLSAEFETEQGATPPAMAALMMQRYMHQYGVDLSDFAGFSVNAHTNGSKNPNAMYRNSLKAERFPSAPAVSAPVSLFDAAPEGDGSATIILTTTERARDLVPQPIRITGSALATDTLAIQDRRDVLALDAVKASSEKALRQSDISLEGINLFELHDSFTIMSTLALEAIGLSEQGKGTTLANAEIISLDGTSPISTFGGLKARGHAGGATGIYQAVEAVLQLRGQAGDNQVSDARTALLQNIGGLGGTAVTHILSTLE